MSGERERGNVGLGEGQEEEEKNSGEGREELFPFLRGGGGGGGGELVLGVLFLTGPWGAEGGESWKPVFAPSPLPPEKGGKEKGKG